MDIKFLKNKKISFKSFHNTPFITVLFGIFTGFVFFLLDKIYIKKIDFVMPGKLNSIGLIVKQKNLSDKKNISSYDINTITTKHKKIIELKENENIATIVNSIEKENILNSNAFIYGISKYIRLSSAQIGFKMNVKYSCSNHFDQCSKNKTDIQNCIPIRDCVISEIHFKDSENKYIITADKANPNMVHAREKKLDVIEKLVYIKGDISSSLYYDAEKSGVNPTVLTSMIKSYGYVLDLQRDIQKGAKYETMYKEYIDKESNESIKKYKLMYANINTLGKDHRIFFYKGKSYSPDGISIIKNFLRTPVDGARISSFFSKGRKHPVLGYTRAHKGIDFAAPTGTRIYAAGDGVVAKKERSLSFGNYVELRHKNKYATRYAHMSKHRKDMRIGQTIKQGEVIGYVGMTGLATGPHLHYEILVNGSQINPLSVKTISNEKLTSAEMPAFNEYKKEINSMVENYIKN